MFSLPDEVLQELSAGVFSSDGLGHAGWTGKLLVCSPRSGPGDTDVF